MSNSFFRFKQFTIEQDKCAMKVTTDSCLFGAWIADNIKNEKTESSIDNLIINNCLDIGTGTGLLSLMLAQSNKGLHIDAIEIDKDAFEQATQNVVASPFKDRIIVQNVNANKFNPPVKYDMIISNPPFYESELKGDDRKKNMAHHNEGLTLPELLDTIKINLGSNGTFYLLLPFKRNEEIKKLIIEHEFDITQLTFIRQSVNHGYFRILLSGKLKSQSSTETIIDEISIKDENDYYTPVFTALLKPYYLKM